jgi:hypothetical protein
VGIQNGGRGPIFPIFVDCGDNTKKNPIPSEVKSWVFTRGLKKILEDLEFYYNLTQMKRPFEKHFRPHFSISYRFTEPWTGPVALYQSD